MTRVIKMFKCIGNEWLIQHLSRCRMENHLSSVGRARRGRGVACMRACEWGCSEPTMKMISALLTRMVWFVSIAPAASRSREKKNKGSNFAAATRYCTKL